MSRSFPVVLAAVALVVTSAHAQDQDSTEVRPLVGQAGHASVSLNGGFAPVGLGARYFVTDGISVGVAFDRTVFAEADPSTRLDPFVSSSSRARTLSVGVESENPTAWDWLTAAYGVQLYAQRQTDDVVEGYEAGFVPTLREGGRRSEGAGLALSLRFEARVVGLFRVGYAASAAGLGVQRIRGGTVEEDGRVVSAGVDDERTRFKFGGGSSRFYVAVRL